MFTTRKGSDAVLKCEVCNKEFLNNASLIKHYKHEQDSQHKNLLVTYYQFKITSRYPHIQVLNITYKNGRPYAQIFNPACNHSSCLRVDNIMDGRKCSHKECISRNKSLASKGKPKSALHRKHIYDATHTTQYRESMSNTLKQKFKDSSFTEKHRLGIYNSRSKHAEGIATWQRRKKSSDEAYVKELLELNDIKLEYQKPFITDKLEIIMDFYLPEYNVYIQVNTDPYHSLDTSSKSTKYKQRALYTIQKDKSIRDLFSENHNLGYLVQIYNLNEMTDIINKLKRGDYYVNY